MSRILKRPMFRKGGEVMEGIMTGIKPRKMFALGTEDQTIVDNVKRKMNLIDVISGGGSPLSDPLTQFLLTAGPDLVAGKAAGGSKLEEIIGGVKPGIDKAIKTQQLKDLSNRKLATQLISKTGAGNFDKAFREYGQYMINPDTKKPYTKEEFRPVYGSTQIYRKGISPAERAQKESQTRRETLAKKKDIFQQQEYNNLQIKRIDAAEEKILRNEKLYELVDTNNPYISSEDYEVGAPLKVKNPEGKIEELRVFVPDDKEDYIPSKVYYLFDNDVFVRYDAQNNRLVELPGI
tara:strand:+ start:88 stop:963 length:876 start_codon:yes stop_codon:yes gene_type:complete